MEYCTTTAFSRKDGFSLITVKSDGKTEKVCFTFFRDADPKNLKVSCDKESNGGINGYPLGVLTREGTERWYGPEWSVGYKEDLGNRNAGD